MIVGLPLIHYNVWFMKIVFAKNELCGKKEAAGIWRGAVGRRGKKCQERRKSYLLLNVESHMRMCREPIPGN